MDTRSRLLFLLTAVVVLTTFLSPIQRELYVGDETKYGEVIREMRTTGSFLVPVLNGHPYSHKPPLHFWAIDLLTRPFGLHSIWPYVLPSLIANLLLLWLVWRFTRELFDSLTAWVATFLTSTFYLVWGIAQTARMDLEFTVLITLAILQLHRFIERESRRDLLLAAVALGVAILVKGPMALVIALLLLLFEGVRRRRFPRGNYAAAVAIVAAIPLLWVIPAVITGGRAYAEELLVKQNIGRAVNSWVHREPLWYYLGHAPGTFLPWFFLFAVSLVAVYRRKDPPAESNRSRFLVSWVLAVLIPFSLISGKLDVYMLPAMIPAAMLGARLVADSRRDLVSKLAVAANATTIALLGMVMVTVAAFAARFLKPTPERELLFLPSVQAMLWTTAAAAAVALLVLLFLRRDRLIPSTVLTGIVATIPLLFLGTALMPVLNDIGSTHELIQALERIDVPGDRIALYYTPYLWSRNMPGNLEDVRYIDADDLGRISPPPSIVVTKSSRAEDLGPALGRYEKFDELRMRGRTFDVYRRR
ncbi:MAG: glycosyltransferase family 39 protein [Thermoanaerobaculia bacterium]